MAITYEAGFASLEEEIAGQTLPNTGAIPGWLAGTLLRNGPGTFEANGKRFGHWFDGPALLHRFSFQNGQVSYANRYLRTPAYAYTSHTQSDQSATGPKLSNANVNIDRVGNRFIAMTEAPNIVEFDPRSLQTIGGFAFQDSLFNGHTTAHPHYDFERDELINFVEQYGQTSAYQIFTLQPGDNRRKLIAEVPASPEIGYMHSFAITQRYIILAEAALFLNLGKMMQRSRDIAENRIEALPVTDYMGFLSSYDWKPERGANFVVVDRRDGSVVGRYQGEAYFAFHHVNAFEEGDRLVIDLAAYPDASINADFKLDNLLSPSGAKVAGGQYRRYTIALKGEYADYEQLSPEAIELPRINYRRNNTKDYRYAYGVGEHQPNDFLDQLVKIDLRERTSKIWYAADCYPGEPVFVARPGATDEDDGVLLSVVLDGKSGTSFLLVLDANSFEEVGRAHVPQPVPFGFHGHFFSQVQA